MENKDHEIEEFEEGKINFEKILERKIEKASEHYRHMEYTEFALTVQQIWNDCLESDREAVLKLVEKWFKEGRFEKVRDVGHFKKLLRAKPYSFTSHYFNDEMHIPHWLEIYKVLNNGLKMRYYGKRRSWEKDEGFKEVD